MFGQPPQLAVLKMSVSHPAAGVQSSHPLAQVPISQASDTHCVVLVFGSATLQSLPQAPQFCTVLTGVSQPSAEVQSP
jgi:hypothetical protein